MNISYTGTLARRIVAMAVLVSASTAWGQHAHTMGIVSDANGGGQLDLVWDFDATPIVRVFDSGVAGIFSHNIPGFNDATGDGVDTFTLATSPTPAQVEVEVVSVDDNLRWIFSGGTLDETGETALLGTMPTLHNHATFELTAPALDNKEFAEGRVSFRVREGASVLGYTPSDVRTLRVSNGYLPPLEAALTEDENKAQLKCQDAVAKAVRSFNAKTYQLLSKCVDATLAHTLLAKSAASALKACNLDDADDKSLVGYIAKAKQKAVDGIAKKCGALSTTSVPYTESQVHTHLGLARCRAEELLGATYNQAADQVGDVLAAAVPPAGDHDAVLAAFPCLKASFD